MPEAVAAGVPVHILGRLVRPYDLGAVLGIARLLRSLSVDIVHVPLYSRASPYVRVAAALEGVPLVVAHEHCRARPPSSTRRAVDRMLAPRTRYVAVSEAQRAELVQSGVAPDSVAVIRNGIDVDRFTPGDRDLARAALGLDPAAKIVLVPARLVPRKGHADLIAALPALAELVPSVRVICAGGGPLSEILPALAGSAGLGDLIDFVGHRDDLPDLLAASDAVCLPSRIEGMPLAVLEAMAAGRAVVAAGVDGVPEVIEDGVTGILVPPSRPPRLAEALAGVLLDEERMQRLGANARAAALARHRDSEMARRLESAYATWLSSVRLPTQRSCRL